MFDDETITVYQAYPAAIAVPAAAGGSFVGTPFKLDRMTWIKPSFLWMMYRCGWATKPGQEHVLAIRMTRAGFEHALSLASLSHFDPDVYPDRVAWARRKEDSPVRVQWDPERDTSLAPLPWRSIQIGLSGPAVDDYVHRWIVQIDDITPRVQELHRAAGQDPSLMPDEVPYPTPPALAHAVGASPQRPAVDVGG